MKKRQTHKQRGKLELLCRRKCVMDKAPGWVRCDLFALRAYTIQSCPRGIPEQPIEPPAQPTILLRRLGAFTIGRRLSDFAELLATIVTIDTFHTDETR